MNIEEYISSGILEAYALGELSAGERVEVEQNIVRYPALKQELVLIEETQEKLLRKIAVKPRSSVKENLFKKMGGKSQGKVVSIYGSETEISFLKYAAAASVAIALITSFLAFNYYGKWRNTENNLNDLIAQNKQMAQDYNTVNQQLDKIETDINVINNPAFSRVVMKGTPNAPDAMAYVYWNENSKEVYLSIQNMKQLSQANQYQLWAIVDGKPVDAGVFNTNVAGLLKMKDLTGAAAFAITIEPRGGKPSPTLETMQVLGYIKG